MLAISLTCKLGIKCDLTHVLKTEQLSNVHTAIGSILDAANQLGIPATIIILKVNQDDLLGQADLFMLMIQGVSW
jgi:hypothetical protein